jgi:hypothetical protein
MMPMKSEAQRRYLQAHYPVVAQEFEAETPAGADLPERINAPSQDPKRRRRDAVRRRAMGSQSAHGSDETRPDPNGGMVYAEVA